MEEHQIIDEKLESFVINVAKYQTVLTKKHKLRKPYEPKDPRKITSFIPGTIKKVCVKQGRKVKEGELLIIFDAMKMHNNIFCPIKTRVKKIYVKDGDLITKDQILMELE